MLNFIIALSFRPDDTAELIEEAARVALCSNQVTSMDSTDALLQTSPLAKPEENTSFIVTTVVSEQLDSKVQDNEQPDIKVNPGIELTIIVFVDNIAFVNPHQVMKGTSKILFPLDLDPNKGNAESGTVATSANSVKDNSLCASSHQNSSFEVISLESR